MRQDEPPIEELLEEDEHEPTRWDGLKDRIHGEWLWFDGFLRRAFLQIFKWSLHLSILLGGCYLLVWWLARDTTYADVKEVPARYAALVMGCRKMTDGYPNTFFNKRIDAAEKLFKEQKVQYLIVSGDNHTEGYNEAADMKEALVNKGIPANHIYCDYAGFRTLDSIVRARKIFGQSDFTIVSQHFHNERALYMAHRFGMGDVVAFDADNAEASGMLKMYARELFSRAMAVLDVEILQTKPRFLGDKIEVGEKTPPVDAEPK